MLTTIHLIHFTLGKFAAGDPRTCNVTFGAKCHTFNKRVASCSAPCLSAMGASHHSEVGHLNSNLNSHLVGELLQIQRSPVLSVKLFGHVIYLIN